MYTGLDHIPGIGVAHVHNLGASASGWQQQCPDMGANHSLDSQPPESSDHRYVYAVPVAGAYSESCTVQHVMTWLTCGRRIQWSQTACGAVFDPLTAGGCAC